MTAPRRANLLWRGFGFLAAAGAIALLALPNPVELSPASGTAAQTLVKPERLIGNWLTVIHTGDRPQPVRLQIHTVELGKTAGKLIYLAPRRCIVDLQYGGADRDRHFFNLVPFTNCFEYGDDDYVAIMGTGEVLPVFNDLSRQSPAYRRMPRQQTANAGVSDSKAADAPDRGDTVERLEYLVHMNGRDIERAFLTRE